MIRYFAFYNSADPSGAVLYVNAMPVEDADAMLAGDPSLRYVEVGGLIDTGDFYVQGGVLMPKQILGVTFDKVEILANGVDTATMTSGLPAGTSITLLGDLYTPGGREDYGVPEMSMTYSSGPFVLTSNTRGPHRLRFEATNYLPEEVLIDVI
ncbi:hypothetical protein GGE65_007731 [Skermanella aerolata]|uniref:hypothetical protein n=1 Tax=Skermanella aerolata TaxID=393310 RepID=UPI003D2229B5